MNQNQEVNMKVRLDDNEARAALERLNIEIEVLKSSSDRTVGILRDIGTNVGAFNALSIAVANLANATGMVESATQKATNALDAKVAAQSKLEIATSSSINAIKAQANANNAAQTSSPKAAAAAGLQAKAQQGLTAAKAKSVVATKVATIAQKGLNIAMKAFPLMAIISLVMTAISVLGNLGSVFGRLRDLIFGANEPMTQHGETVSQLADRWGTTTETIKAEMEEYGLTLDEWAQRQEDLLEEVADRWNVYAEDIMEALGEIDLNEWVAQQEEQLENLADAWNVSTDYIMQALEEQGISLEQWEAAQYEILDGLGEQWGMSTDEILAQMQEMGKTKAAPWRAA